MARFAALCDPAQRSRYLHPAHSIRRHRGTSPCHPWGACAGAGGSARADGGAIATRARTGEGRNNEKPRRTGSATARQPWLHPGRRIVDPAGARHAGVDRVSLRGAIRHRARFRSKRCCRADALITAGLELTAYRLSMSTNPRPTRGEFRFRLARTSVEVEYLSEAARVDLNSAPKALITGLFAALGAQPGDAAGYADRVIGWRTSGEARRARQRGGTVSRRGAALSTAPGAIQSHRGTGAGRWGCRRPWSNTPLPSSRSSAAVGM